MPSAKTYWIALPDGLFREVSSSVSPAFAAVAQLADGEWFPVGKPFRTEAEAAAVVEAYNAGNDDAAQVAPVLDAAAKVAELERRAAEYLAPSAAAEAEQPAAEVETAEAEQPAAVELYVIRYNRTTNHIQGIPERTPVSGDGMTYAQSACPVLTRSYNLAAGLTTNNLDMMMSSVRTYGGRRLCAHCERAAEALLSQRAAEAEQQAAEVAEAVEAVEPAAEVEQPAVVEAAEVVEQQAAEAVPAESPAVKATRKASRNATAAITDELHVRMPDGELASILAVEPYTWAVAILVGDRWTVDTWHLARKDAENRSVVKDMRGETRIVLPVMDADALDDETRGAAAMAAADKYRAEFDAIAAKIAAKRGDAPAPATTTVTVTLLNDSHGIVEGLPQPAVMQWVKGKYVVTCQDGRQTTAGLKEKSIKSMAILLGIKGRILVAIDTL